MGKKPFSTRLKKQQLLAKREKKRIQQRFRTLAGIAAFQFSYSLS